MKVVVTSQGDSLDSVVDQRFGRGAWFLVVDLESDEVTALDNAAGAGAGQGAGVQAAQAVASSGAGALLTGHCGPKAFMLLDQAGVSVYTGVEGTVREAVEAYKAGSLEATSKPDVDGHW